MDFYAVILACRQVTARQLVWSCGNREFPLTTVETEGEDNPSCNENKTKATDKNSRPYPKGKQIKKLLRLNVTF